MGSFGPPLLSSLPAEGGSEGDPAAATKSAGRCRLGPPPAFTPRRGPRFLKAAPGSEAPGAPPSLCNPPPRPQAPGFPGSGAQAGRPTGQPGREGAGWPPKSAPSYMWEEVAVTQVSRGPWARKERARAAPFHAAATRPAPQAAFAVSAGPSCAPAVPGGRRARRPCTGRSPPDPGRAG